MKVSATPVKHLAALPGLAVLLLALVWGLWPARALAATIDLTGNCPGGVGDVPALVAAMNTANTNAGADTIVLATNCTYALTAAAGSYPTLGAWGLPEIDGELTIEGHGSTIRRSAGAPNFRILLAQAPLTLRQLTIAGGAASGAVGSAGNGGGVLANGFSMTVDQSTFDANTAAGSGGAIAMAGPTPLVVTNSTFVGNRADATGTAGGGAIYVAGATTIANSTFAGNSALNGVGAAIGVPFGSVTTITHSTFTGNSSPGSTIFNSGTVNMTNTLIANQQSGTNCGIGSDGNRSYNLADDDTCGVGFTQVSPSQVRLGFLTDNGGPTRTYALLANSKAINAGDPGYAAGGFDQRGSGFPRVRSGRTDIGAFEATAASVGGSVSGLEGSGLVLTLNGGHNLAIGANGSFTFDTWLIQYDSYTVGIAGQPANRPQICTLGNEAGIMGAENVTNVTVTCVVDQRNLAVSRAGNGSGSVTSDPAAIDCGATCSAPVDRDTVVALTATAATGSVFTGWSGDCAGLAACSVTMSAARSVTATFALKTYALAVTKDGSGSGTVAGVPPNAAALTYGTVVTLTAAAEPSSVFAGWSGDCAGKGACVVTLTANRSVTATFQVKQLDVSVLAAGRGGSVEIEVITPTVQSAAALVAVRVSGADAPDAQYPYGSTLRLTAVPSPGWFWVAWGSDLTGAPNPVEITLTGAITVSAQFNTNNVWIPLVVGADQAR